jgi:hypothetical protein
MRIFWETPMLRSTAARRSPLAATFSALVLLALALFWMAPPARGADAPAKPEAAAKATRDATVSIIAFPPAIHVDTTTTDSGDIPDKGRRGSARIRIDDDEDFDVFSGQVRKNPWIIGLIFLVVGSIFLTPVVLLIGIIWYKLRKTRLQNEAMLKLAEQGVVPTAQAADALVNSTPPATAAPQIYQQALALRRRLVWSDLRKGVILAAIGIAFLAYEANTGGGPSWIGLILLFLGIGYVLLWWLEGRHLQKASASGNGGGTTTPIGGNGGGSVGTGGG